MQVLALRLEAAEQIEARAHAGLAGLQRLLVALLLALPGDDLGQPEVSRPGLLPVDLPDALGLVAGLLLAQLPEPIHLLAILPDPPLQIGVLAREPLVRLERRSEVAGGPAGGGQQARALPGDPGDQLVPRGAGHLAEAGAQDGLQVAARMLDRLVDLLPGALLDPQQAGDAPVLRSAGPAPGELEAEQVRELVLRLLAAEPHAVYADIAALALQEALDQLPALALRLELQLDRGRGGRIAPGLQILHAGGLVALEECSADRAHQGALAGLVRSGEEVDAGIEIADLYGLPEAAQLFDLQAQQPHAAAPWACASSSSAARIASASLATSAFSPSCSSRSSAITRPT